MQPTQPMPTTPPTTSKKHVILRHKLISILVVMILFSIVSIILNSTAYNRFAEWDKAFSTSYNGQASGHNPITKKIYAIEAARDPNLSSFDFCGTNYIKISRSTPKGLLGAGFAPIVHATNENTYYALASSSSSCN